MFFVYILYQPNRNEFYIGLTSNLKRRFREHFYSKVVSTKSIVNKPKLIYFEAFLSKKDAIRREKYLKTSKGKRVLKLMLKDALSKIT